MRIFTPNTEDITDFYEKGKYILAWRIAVIFTFFFSIILVINLITNPIGAFTIILVLLTAISGLYFIKKTKKIRVVFWIFAVGGTITPLLALNLLPSYTHFVDFLWLPTCILVAYVGLGNKEGLFFVFIDIIGIGIFYAFSLNNHLETITKRTPLELAADYAEIVFAIIIMVSFLTQFVKFQKYAEKNIKEKNNELKEQNAIISAKNRENENLLKEIHHRVKNNLQIIISLLRMQSGEMKNKEAKQHFQEAINRVMAMSLIHQKLYSTKDVTRIDLKSYIEELIEDILLASSLHENEVEKIIDTSIIDIDLTTLVPVGLLLNEVVSNTLKHAKPLEGNIKINIKIIDSEDSIVLNYCDNGTWKEPTKEHSSFGLELIDILTEQLDGEKQLDTTNGVCYHFKFPKN